MSFIILDRDGVINHDSENYIKSPDEWHPIAGSLEAIAHLNRQGFKILVATNQSGIGRGYFDIATLDSIHEKLMHELAGVGGYIEEFFFCPHLAIDNCSCRKPKDGMIKNMQKKYLLNPEETFFIGDSWSDIKAAQLSGCLPILVLTGNGKNSLSQYPQLVNIPHFHDLSSAVPYVISQFRQ
jgi:D-glycero-D-manno-heptose 1,7-bisphosphate phosphatase